MNAEVRSIRTAAESALVEAFAAVGPSLPGGADVTERRAAALREIAERGLPTRRVEDWKYFDLRALMREARPLAAPISDAEIEAARALLPLAGFDAARIVFVNGQFCAALSDFDPLPEGASATWLADALGDDGAALLDRGEAPAGNAAVALNAAFVADGIVLRIAPGVAVARPIHVANVQTGAAHAAFGRVAVTAGEGASATIVESHVGSPEGHQTNTHVAVTLADRADVTLVKLQDEGLGTLHLATLTATLGAGAKLSSLALSAGSAAARQQVYLAFRGDRSTAEIRGAGFAGARRLLDTTLVVEHDALGCASREHFKTALDGEARSVFQGKIVVKPGAQKTDGKMMAQALLLSEGAEADAKPELEIFADDVVCGHGATVGALDDELLFYLKSRGIPQKEAEALMVQAFVGEVIETVEHEALRDALTARSERWLIARD
ncbi:Fe-S cluster assembly protein SufD [Methylopila turkensis]|uniref:Fe-S cluster assembly protein SufD n=1 Tax=Methylopila turkensis TaxID=1437816 RepID=A0A9W6N823_9HYPH|nr:Fe-S cluster assembly protein SufD [Methylopila turkensis]GLK80997.1 Fe-S cluster assembly protein SufD [Methylopila turkensis]